MISERDTYYMTEALSLAEEGLGRVAPNPSVGCVLVKEGRVIARARTQDGGRPHAEAAALDAAGSDARGATAYVTLEPCFHENRSSCAASLIAAGISRVVIGCRDENPAITGKGVAALKSAGVSVTENCLEESCRTLNRGFFLSKTKNRPLVTLKTALSLDSKIALSNGQSRWITGPQSRARVHVERSRHDAILTGINTVLADDPELTTRVENIDHKSTRIVLDTSLKFPLSSRMLPTKDRGEIIVFTGEESSKDVKAQLEDSGVRVVTLATKPADTLPLPLVLSTLAKEGITRLMVEAGQGVVTSFLQSGLWDYLHLYRAPLLLGSDGRDAFGPLGLSDLGSALRPRLLSRESFGDDVLEIYGNPL